MLLLQQVQHLGTGPEHGAIAMGSHHVDGAVGVEGGVEGETCAHASAFHLSLLVHMGVDVVPCEEGLGTVGLGIEPTLVDGMGKAVAVDGGAGGLEIGVGTVESYRKFIRFRKWKYYN